MTAAYLTKRENDRLHFFRATVTDHGVDKVSGVFYEWIAKSWEGCGTLEQAKVRLEKLVAEKISEGFGVTEYVELPENTEDVYDKAEWHFGGNFPDELDDFQGYVHTGMFLGWLIDKGLTSDGFNETLEEVKEQFDRKEITGPEIFEQFCDGTLGPEELSFEGNRFALHYFNLDRGDYLKDYERVLGSGLPSLYHVQDTRENFDKLRPVIDQRFADWKASDPSLPY